jgi:hypothetical protein
MILRQRFEQKPWDSLDQDPSANRLCLESTFRYDMHFVYPFIRPHRIQIQLHGTRLLVCMLCEIPCLTTPASPSLGWMQAVLLSRISAWYRRQGYKLRAHYYIRARSERERRERTGDFAMCGCFNYGFTSRYASDPVCTCTYI